MRLGQMFSEADTHATGSFRYFGPLKNRKCLQFVARSTKICLCVIANFIPSHSAKQKCVATKSTVAKLSFKKGTNLSERPCREITKESEKERETSKVSKHYTHTSDQASKVE